MSRKFEVPMIDMTLRPPAARTFRLPSRKWFVGPVIITVYTGENTLKREYHPELDLSRTLWKEYALGLDFVPEHQGSQTQETRILQIEEVATPDEVATIISTYADGQWVQADPAQLLALGEYALTHPSDAATKVPFPLIATAMPRSATGTAVVGSERIHVYPQLSALRNRLIGSVLLLPVLPVGEHPSKNHTFPAGSKFLVVAGRR